MSSWRDFWKIHPAADVFPLMGADALRKLADDIEANGLKVPVERRLTENGVYVIDGRNRLDALESAGVQLVDDKGGWLHPEYVHSDGKECTDAEIAVEVIGYNIHRRHLTKQEQVELIDKTLTAANVVSRHDGGKLKRPEGRPVDQHKAAVVEQAAKVGISKRTVERVLTKDKPEA
jgi:ParB-like nuclease domain